MGVESTHFHGIVNGESLWNVLCCLLCIFYCQTTPILKSLGQFENLVFVIMSNIRLIARISLVAININILVKRLVHRSQELTFYLLLSTGSTQELPVPTWLKKCCLWRNILCHMHIITPSVSRRTKTCLWGFWQSKPSNQSTQLHNMVRLATVLPAKSDSDFMFCLQS